MEQWKRIIQDCQTSRLGNKIYCEQHEISEKMYYYWLRKLRRLAMEQAAPQIMETEVETEQEERAEELYIWY